MEVICYFRVVLTPDPVAQPVPAVWLPPSVEHRYR